MPTQDEIEEWCLSKALDSLRFPTLYKAQQIAKLLKEAYEYGFSQGAGINGSQDI
jgi:hypothetical protein